MLTTIISFVVSNIWPILKNPKTLYAAFILLLFAGVFRQGCQCQKEKDAAEIATLKARITAIENAPVTEHVEHFTTPANPKPTKPLSVIGEDRWTRGYQRAKDSLEQVYGDSLSLWKSHALAISMPFDSTTTTDTLKVDSLFSMPYRLQLGAEPLRRALTGLLLAENFNVNRDRFIRTITMPPEGRPWYEIPLAVLAVVLAFFLGQSV